MLVNSLSSHEDPHFFFNIHAQAVTLVLIDNDIHEASLNDEFYTSMNELSSRGLLLDKLKTKLRKTRNKPFSLAFKNIFTIDKMSFHKSRALYAAHSNKQLTFSYPLDVKISYTHQCFCVSDNGNDRILIFDLESKQLIMNFKNSSTVQAGHLYIEELFNSENTEYSRATETVQEDALYFASHGNSISKYNLNEILKNGKKSDMIWKCSNFKVVTGIALFKQKFPNQVFVGDFADRCVKILDSENGQILQTFYVEGCPWGLEFNTINGDLIVSNNSSSGINIYRNSGMIENSDELGNNSSIKEAPVWKCIRTVGTHGSTVGCFSFPRGMTFDSCSDLLLVIDHMNCRMQVMNLHDGTVVKCFGSKGRGESQFMLPDGHCLNRLTGELFLCDTHNQRVQIFV
ncbi:hypothetical protein C9374_001810 [Naegleria lovaniensis]|uniref:Uncharacterized protein n=1 Tax=Naegleria lovaniensis TaxID=51637 RepID=A0AA88GXG0_NAELO|nr:uncharacterized protein C9374_001810 [Naegleria lovaniensis]KAG2387478.1 hypothetical protein C9374_001810 [Naegleria lovaniensis]